MTTFNDDLQDREQRFGRGYVNSQGTQTDGFVDPGGEYPRTEYRGQSNVNQAARGGQQHTLDTTGFGDLPPVASSQYGMSDINETASGHVMEFNDTPSGERILIKHNNGSGVEFRPDGTIVIMSTHNRVEICHGDNKVKVEGDADLSYEGNLTINVKGDYEVNCNNFKVNAKGNKNEDIQGSSRTKVFGNMGTTVSGNSSSTVVGASVNTLLGGLTQAVKGNLKQAVEGDVTIASSGVTSITSEGKMIQSSPDINIAAQSLSVFGDTGTIGGQNIIMYNYNMHTEKSVWAETMTANVVYGDLEGTANQAVTADVTNSQNYPSNQTGSTSGYSVDDTDRDTKATALPTSSLLASYLTKGANGIKEVLIDVGDHLKNSLKERKLSPQDARSKMRDAANAENPEFTANQIGAGNLNPNFASATPPGGFGRIRPASGNCQRGTAPVGNASPERATATFRTEAPKQVHQLSPPADEAYTEANANVSSRLDSKGATPAAAATPAATPSSATDDGGLGQRPVPATAAQPATDTSELKARRNGAFGTVTTKSRINGGVKLARFIGANDAGDFDSLDDATKRQLARNYYAHVALTRPIIQSPRCKYKDKRLDVIEGFYAKEIYGMRQSTGEIEEEYVTPGGLLDLRSQGRAVIYEITDRDGLIDGFGTFDVATSLAEVGLFDKLTLDYDSYNSDNSLNVQIIVEIPNVPEDFKVTYKQEVETRFNGKLQGANSLIEIKPTQDFPIFRSVSEL